MDAWRSVKDSLPANGELVLVARRGKKKNRWSMTLAKCIPEYTFVDPMTREREIGPYWICEGNTNILYWMPLPALPLDIWKEQLVDDDDAGYED